VTEIRVSVPDELYWRLGRLKYVFKTRNWRDFLAKMCDIVEEKMKPLYVDERDMVCLVLAFAVWKSLEYFDARDWERLSAFEGIPTFNRNKAMYLFVRLLGEKGFRVVETAVEGMISKEELKEVVREVIREELPSLLRTAEHLKTYVK